jgi:hypothetical protein
MGPRSKALVRFGLVAPAAHQTPFRITASLADLKNMTQPSDKTPATEIPGDFLAQIKQDLAARRIDSGIQSLSAHKQFLDSNQPRQKDSAVLLGYFAQWVDVGFPERRLLKQLLAKFSSVPAETLSLLDYAHLRMAEGLVAMSEEEFSKAIKCFNTVLALEHELSDK